MIKNIRSFIFIFLSALSVLLLQSKTLSAQDDSLIVVKKGNPQIPDPFIKSNKTVYDFNLAFYSFFKTPLDKYEELPIELRWTIKTLSAQYNEQIFYTVNNLIDLDLEGFVLSFWKFYINFIFGFGGLYDIANQLEIPLAEKTISDVLFKYDIIGPYLMVPFIGAKMGSQAGDLLLDNAIRAAEFPYLISLGLSFLNYPNVALDDLTLINITGSPSSYTLNKKNYYRKFLREKEKIRKASKEGRLKMRNTCDNNNLLEPCSIENSNLTDLAPNG